MPTLTIKRLTLKQRERIVAALHAVQGKASARTLSPDDVVDAYARARRHGWASEHGGYVPNGYRYPAEATAVAAVRDGDTVVLRIGRGRTQGRAGGNGSTVDVSVRTQLGAPEWTRNAEERAARYRAWLTPESAPCAPLPETRSD